MKVLFAVSNESISDSIVKKYQKDYKEIISYKNVYYFNAILKEIQRDKTYDRIIISEDLEPFANNDYEAIDRFIFDKLDSISDEAIDNKGEDTPIILICTDRRTKGEQLLVKLFGIGVYSALLGQDRSIEEVCKLIRKPRTKKEAKIYYKIESEDVNYQSESEDTVSEVEIQNIRTHYRKLGKNEDAYVESFNNIASQYTDSQLKVIVKFLPINVKAVLERDSSKYQSIMAFSGQTAKVESKKTQNKKDDGLKMDLIENQLNKQKITKPVIVPSAVNSQSVKKVSKKPVETLNSEGEEDIKPVMPVNIFELDEKTEPDVEPVKRGRGRPKKVLTEEEKLKQEQTPKRGRGRPKKTVETESDNQFINLFDLEEANSSEQSNNILPGFDEPEEENIDTILPGFSEEKESYKPIEDLNTNKNETNETANNSFLKTNVQHVDIESLLTQEKKMVSFVGTTKNGTSFLVNNLAELLSSMGINTAILDMTKNKNSYFIYTKNEEPLRRIAANCMTNLANDVPEGIKVNENLTVYTTIPSQQDNIDVGTIISTLVKNYSLVLIDCDFDTPFDVFQYAQEIYLVQSMDILTIQPLTAFLRELKAKNAIIHEKLKVIVNKEARIRGLTSKVIIGGMAFYNDPSMTFMTELFNKDAIKYTTVPYSDVVYAKYIEGLVNCKISLNGYDKNFMGALKELAKMVYPLLNSKNKTINK
jgi:hypothetical protein